VAVSLGLTGTCNVLSAGSAVVSPCVEKSLHRQRDDHLEPSVISGLTLRDAPEAQGHCLRRVRHSGIVIYRPYFCAIGTDQS
jgi:hypothetical protein